MASLGVNVDHIATLRQVRRAMYPNPAIAAKIAQDCGADQITCHLREDRRHIQDSDITAIQEAIQIPLNLEMAATEEMRDLAFKFLPQKITLVPEKREEVTTEGGLDVMGHEAFLQSYLKPFLSRQMEISLFIDPDPRQIEASQRLGVQAVEFHTGDYCQAFDQNNYDSELQRLSVACSMAKKLGLFVAAGHGLNYQNIFPVRRIVEIQEFNIGHSIVAHAVLVGWERAVRELKSLIEN